MAFFSRRKPAEVRTPVVTEEAPAPVAATVAIKLPPRPVAVGDIVVGYSRDLGAWTAVQITGWDAGWKKVGVLELDWLGPAAPQLDDLLSVKPLSLTHHSWTGGLAHTNRDWLVPRSCRIVGNLPLLTLTASNSYASSWDLGVQLAMQRRWDSGDHGPYKDPGSRRGTSEDVLGAAAVRSSSKIQELRVDDITSLDCRLLAAVYPNLRCLQLFGTQGVLESAHALNDLSELRELWINDLFGLSAGDALRPSEVPKLEWLNLHSVPRAYADATRKLWKPQIVEGTALHISAARKPEWVAENAHNPLRQWDGREHISRSEYVKSVATLKVTRAAIISAVSSAVDEGAVYRLGTDYALAFNKLASRSDFIETVEREELFEALRALWLDAGGSAEKLDSLCKGVDDAREW